MALRLHRTEANISPELGLDHLVGTAVIVAGLAIRTAGLGARPRLGDHSPDAARATEMVATG